MTFWCAGCDASPCPVFFSHQAFAAKGKASDSPIPQGLLGLHVGHYLRIIVLLSLHVWGRVRVFSWRHVVFGWGRSRKLQIFHRWTSCGSSFWTWEAILICSLHSPLLVHYLLTSTQKYLSLPSSTLPVTSTSALFQTPSLELQDFHIAIKDEAFRHRIFFAFSWSWSLSAGWKVWKESLVVSGWGWLFHREFRLSEPVFERRMWFDPSCAGLFEINSFL